MSKVKIAILGEDKSDVETLKELIRLIAGTRSISLKGKGFTGGGNLKKEGAKYLQLFLTQGCTHFVVCHDADGPNPKKVREELRSRVVKPSKLKDEIVVVIPVQEIGAWIIADNKAVQKILSHWKPKEEKNPEKIDNPKEYFRDRSKKNKTKPLYDAATHNPKVAKYLDVDIIHKKCPSFHDLHSFVQTHGK